MKLDAKQVYRLLLVGGGLVLFAALYIDDWGRDLVRHEAAIETGSAEPALRPLEVRRPPVEVVAAVKMAARRIRNWNYTGEVTDGQTTLISYVRTHRLLRTRQDVTVRVQGRGNRSVVTGESRSRLPLGDLGRNPRNLRRLLSELRDVLDGAAPGAVSGGNR